MNYNLVSQVGTCAKDFVLRKIPSEVIPFSGTFPLLKNYEYEFYIEEMDKTMFVDDLSERFKDVTLKAFQIYQMDKDFKSYLEENRIDLENFKALSNSKKADTLINWLDKNCLDFTSLKIN